MQLLVDGLIYQLQRRGGISAYFNAVLPRLCELDPALEITLFHSGETLQPLPQHARIEAARLPAVEKLFRPGRWFQRQGAQARLRLAGRRFDQLAAATWHSTYYTWLEGWRGPEVVTVYDMILERFPSLFDRPGHEDLRERKRRCVARAGRILCISQAGRDDLCELLGVAPERCRVVPLACSPVFQPPAAPLAASGRPYLLYVGARQRHKNFDFLLQGLSRWQGFEEIELVAAGGAWTGAEERRMHELGLRQRVRLVEDPSDEGLCALYQGALGLVFPSLYEGFGLPLLEAMQCGCPIAAARIPATVEVAGEAPIYFEPTEVDTLLAALKALVQEGRESSRAARGLRRAPEFSWEKTARGVWEVYQEV